MPVSLPGHLTPSPDEGLRERGARFLPLSAKSEGALLESAQGYLSWLDEHAGEFSSDTATVRVGHPPLADMAWTAGIGRSHFDHRAGVPFRDANSLREGLKALGTTGERIHPRTSSKVAFVFTGQGTHWVGMGRELYETEPVARAVLDRCEAVFREERGASLLDVMFGRGGAEGDMDSIEWGHPAIYALEAALTYQWASVGVKPDVVVGHSFGEIAAAQAAGVFGLEDGMRFAMGRALLLSRTEEGAMAAAFAPAEWVEAAVDELNAAHGGVELSIAVDNGTQQVVSGPVEKVEAISQRLENEEVRVTRLNARQAFHSALLEPVLDDLEALLESVAISAPSPAPGQQRHQPNGGA